MVTVRGSKNTRKNRGIKGVQILGCFIHVGMKIEIMGYDQDRMNCKEQIIAKGTVFAIEDSFLGIKDEEGRKSYVHLNGVTMLRYDSEDSL